MTRTVPPPQRELTTVEHPQEQMITPLVNTATAKTSRVTNDSIVLKTRTN